MQQWPRLSEQQSPIFKWKRGWVVEMQSCPRRRAGCLTPARTSAAVGNSGRIGNLILNFISRSHLHVGQPLPIGLIWRLVVNARMPAFHIVPIDVFSNVCLSLAHTIVCPQVDTLILKAGVRSFIITFDVHACLKIFEKYDNERLDSIC